MYKVYKDDATANLPRSKCYRLTRCNFVPQFDRSHFAVVIQLGSPTLPKFDPQVRQHPRIQLVHRPVGVSRPVHFDSCRYALVRKSAFSSLRLFVCVCVFFSVSALLHAVTLPTLSQLPVNHRFVTSREVEVHFALWKPVMICPKQPQTKLRQETMSLHCGNIPSILLFLFSEKKDDKDNRHKRAPISKGPYLVKSINTDSNSILVVRKYKTV